jgi:hypothetical protein
MKCYDDEQIRNHQCALEVHKPFPRPLLLGYSILVNFALVPKVGLWEHTYQGQLCCRGVAVGFMLTTRIHCLTAKHSFPAWLALPKP